jgi:pimeloyl-ACP methyl ester carboxylesterase
MSNFSAPHVKLSDAGSTIHFSHANGYPPLCYKGLLSPFMRDYRLIASLHRPLWPQFAEPSSMNSWEQLGEDILDLLVEVEIPTISIGHSMGSAAILMAAVKKPEYFKKIVLIEPVLVPRFATIILGAFPSLARRAWPLARQTINRVDKWPNRGAVFEHFRPKGVFKRISDEILWDYVNEGTVINELGEYELIFNKEWELQCYLKVYNCWNLFKSLKVPSLIVRGSESNTLSKKAWDRLRKISPQSEYVEIPDSGHLVPFERPETLASEIIDWVNR